MSFVFPPVTRTFDAVAIARTSAGEELTPTRSAIRAATRTGERSHEPYTFGGADSPILSAASPHQ
jgi:hypothetical protein